MYKNGVDAVCSGQCGAYYALLLLVKKEIPTQLKAIEYNRKIAELKGTEEPAQLCLTDKCLPPPSKKLCIKDDSDEEIAGDDGTIVAVQDLAMVAADNLT